VQSVQFEVNLQLGVLLSMLAFAARIIESPDVDDLLLQRTELALAFVRNVVIIPCDPIALERLFVP
jgi:hypothetical protein